MYDTEVLLLLCSYIFILASCLVTAVMMSYMANVRGVDEMSKRCLMINKVAYIHLKQLKAT